MLFITAGLLLGERMFGGVDKLEMLSYNVGVHEKNELLNYRPPVVGGFYAFVFYRASLVHQEMLFLIIGGIMDITLIRKAIALIAKQKKNL